SGKVADLDHANSVSILLAKKRHRLVLIDRHIDRNVRDGLYFLVAQHFLVDQVFDVLQLFVFHGSEMREVKAEMIRRHQRSRLLHMLAQHLAQARMKKMRSRMIAHGGLTDVGVNYGVHFIAHAKCPPTRVLGTSSTEGAPSSRVFCGGWGDR